MGMEVLFKPSCLHASPGLGGAAVSCSPKGSTRAVLVAEISTATPEPKALTSQPSLPSAGLGLGGLGGLGSWGARNARLPLLLALLAVAACVLHC